MIEVANHPEAPGAVLLHSTESGQFLACERAELRRLAAAIKRGELDAFLSGAVTVVDEDAATEAGSAGRAAYEAFYPAVDGNPALPWAAVSADIRRGWHAAANAVASYLAVDFKRARANKLE